MNMVLPPTDMVLYQKIPPSAKAKEIGTFCNSLNLLLFACLLHHVVRVYREQWVQVTTEVFDPRTNMWDDVVQWNPNTNSVV